VPIGFSPQASCQQEGVCELLQSLVADGPQASGLLSRREGPDAVSVPVIGCSAISRLAVKHCCVKASFLYVYVFTLPDTRILGRGLLPSRRGGGRASRFLSSTGSRTFGRSVQQVKRRQHQAVAVMFGCLCCAHDEGCVDRVRLCLFSMSHGACSMSSVR